MSNRDLPASPESVSATATGDLYRTSDTGYTGLTKLETAAIAVMQGIMANPNTDGAVNISDITSHSLLIANALFDEMEK